MNNRGWKCFFRTEREATRFFKNRKIEKLVFLIGKSIFVKGKSIFPKTKVRKRKSHLSSFPLFGRRISTPPCLPETIPMEYMINNLMFGQLTSLFTFWYY